MRLRVMADRRNGHRQAVRLPSRFVSRGSGDRKDVVGAPSWARPELALVAPTRIFSRRPVGGNG